MNSFITLWVARENQPSELVINYGPWNLTAGSTADDQKFGKIWLLPYHTGKSSAQSHATGYTWYDELIISRTQIADPGPSSSIGSSGSGTTTPSTGGSTGSTSGSTGSATATDTTQPSTPTGGTAAAGGSSSGSTPSQTGSSISALAASMQPGTWAELVNTNGFNNGTVFRPGGGAGSILEYTDRGSWNPINRTVMILGGAHATGKVACDTSAFVKYTESTNTWTNTLPNPCPDFDRAFSGGIGHGYQHNTINPNTGNFYHRQYYSWEGDGIHATPRRVGVRSPPFPPGHSRSRGLSSTFRIATAWCFSTATGEFGNTVCRQAPGRSVRVRSAVGSRHS